MTGGPTARIPDVRSGSGTLLSQPGTQMLKASEVLARRRIQMRKIGLSLAVMLAAAAAAGRFEPPRVKAGLWVTTGTTTTRGMMPFPEDLLQKMTPEQRKRVESKMQPDSAGKTTTRAYKTCLTQEQLDDWQLYDKFEEGCKQSIDASTGSRMNSRLNCDFGEGVTATGVVRLEVMSLERTKATLHMVAHGNGHEITSDAIMSSRWLRRDCGDVK